MRNFGFNLFQLINEVQEKDIGKTMVQSLDPDKLQPLEKSLRQELVRFLVENFSKENEKLLFLQNEVAATIRNRQTEELDRLMNEKELSKYSVNGNEEIWKNELKNVVEPGIVSIPR